MIIKLPDGKFPNKILESNYFWQFNFEIFGPVNFKLFIMGV